LRKEGRDRLIYNSIPEERGGRLLVHDQKEKKRKRRGAKVCFEREKKREMSRTYPWKERESNGRNLFIREKGQEVRFFQDKE